MAATGASKTAVINQALLVYGWFTEARDHTGRLRYVGADGVQETVMVIA
jgi:hypothetical protein